MAKDFFDEEYEKQTEQNSANASGGSWFDTPAPREEQTKRNKPLYIALVCLALVLCIALGWVLCTIVQGIGFDYNTDGEGIANYGDDILATVIRYLKENYYKDVDEEHWLNAIEYSGTALLQKAGDRFSQLMSPQTYYDFTYSTAAEVTEEIFGISFVVEEGVGLYVSDVSANSGAYGKLQEGDIVLKLTDVADKSGNAPVVDDETYANVLISELTTAQVTEIVTKAHVATFWVLRFDAATEQGFKVFDVRLTRQKIRPIATDYPYNFVEFYFDRQHSNVSLPSPDGTYSTYEERHLDQLPKGVGYVRITQFMDYTKLLDGSLVKVSAAEEFREVMQLFSDLGLTHLVLDLKGNPGGNVAYVCAIASMLVTDAKLSDADKAKVKVGDELLITYLEMPKLNHTQQYSEKSSYSNYFGAVGNKCDVVVWTDGGSASASELLTGALLDYGTAVQMGVTTYGKGIAQTWQPLPFYGTVTDLNGNQIEFPWAIYYTCASYYSPFGTNIHGVGYTPQKPYDNLKSYADLWNAANSYWS